MIARQDRRWSVALRPPRLSFALPALIAGLLILVTARAALAIARDASFPEDVAGEGGAGGATSSGERHGPAPSCLPSRDSREEDPEATRPVPAPPGAAIPSPGPAADRGCLPAAARLRELRDPHPLSPAAPCSERAPPPRAA
jgi:hypothetical protein